MFNVHFNSVILLRPFIYISMVGRYTSIEVTTTLFAEYIAYIFINYVVRILGPIMIFYTPTNDRMIQPWGDRPITDVI